MVTTPGPYATEPGSSGDGTRALPEVRAVQVVPVLGIPEIATGHDVAWLIQSACAATGLALVGGDIVVVSSKVLSKAAGLWAADRTSAIGQSTVRVVAERTTPDGLTQVVESVAGPVMAAGGVDASNTGGSDGVLLLPTDPDAAAASLLADLLRVTGLSPGSLGVVVTDTAGRPWRGGQTDFALGAAGVLVLDDLRGSVDADGRPLAVTARALVDEIAAAADLVKGKATGVPVAVVRGLGSLLVGASRDDTGSTLGAGSLVRTGPTDWFRLGHLEAVRAALGVEPGSAGAVAVGVRPLQPETLGERLARVVRLAQAGQGSTGSIDVSDDVVTVRAADEFDLGTIATRVVIAGWTENLDLTTTERTPGRARLTAVDLTPPPSSSHAV